MRHHGRLRAAGARLNLRALAIVLAGSMGLATAVQTEVTSSRVAQLYEKQCALCHGASGEADGPAAYLLFPPARDFTRGHFKLSDTVNGTPTADERIATLRRGMPGSAMPSWDWMDEADLRALVDHVEDLALQGLVERMADEHEDLSSAELLARARERMTPGDPVPTGTEPAATTELLEVGRKAFLAHCAACHGADGKGRQQTLRRDEDGVINWARDFTAGILKGGGSHEEIDRRLQTGIHGTAMPGTRLGQDQRLALITYVRHLIPKGAEDRLVQRRETITALRVDRLPREASPGEVMSAFDWSVAREVPIVLAPLWWKDDAIVSASVAALHDGESLALRIRWPDATTDAPMRDAPPYTDAVAVQLSTAEHPAFFGMGHDDGPTNIWHWEATRVLERDDLELMISLFPHRMGDWLAQRVLSEAPFYQPAGGPLTLSGQAVTARPAGMKVLREQETLPPTISATADWRDGEWQVVLRRQLAPSSPRELPLEPGSRSSINFAIWNGAVRDLRGHKSVTLWHELRLQR